jgi:hypothetical protein
MPLSLGRTSLSRARCCVAITLRAFTGQATKFVQLQEVLWSRRESNPRRRWFSRVEDRIHGAPIYLALGLALGSLDGVNGRRLGEQLPTRFSLRHA